MQKEILLGLKFGSERGSLYEFLALLISIENAIATASFFLYLECIFHYILVYNYTRLLSPCNPIKRDKLGRK